jgi:hypothetical protein
LNPTYDELVSNIVSNVNSRRYVKEALSQVDIMRGGREIAEAEVERLTTQISSMQTMLSEVGRRCFTLSKPVLKELMVSVLVTETS